MDNAKYSRQVVPVMQTKFGDPDGNCLEACYATITGIPLDDFPHFLSNAWLFHYRNWLREHGWHLFWAKSGTCDVPPGYAIASGPANRGLDHSVVFLDGHLWHDPHPSGDGLLSIDDWQLIWPTREALHG